MRELDNAVAMTGVDPRPGRGLVFLDTSPRTASEILRRDQPHRRRERYRRFQHGPAAFRVDLAVRQRIPWAHEARHSAGTIHLGGTAGEVVTADGACWDGALPLTPFVVLAQPHVADAARSVRFDGTDVHPIWACAHVPSGYPGDATRPVVRQIERFAPGARKRVVGTWVRRTAELAEHDVNLIGGDVCGGANDVRPFVTSPREFRPYETGVPRVLLCSASTPPGAGVHGMSGFNAALRGERA